MKGKMSITQNQNEYILVLGVTNQDLRQASKIQPNPLELRDEKGNVIFQLASSPTTRFRDEIVTFPIQDNKQNVVVTFPIHETDPTDATYLVARVQERLITVEKQVKTALKGMQKQIDNVEVIKHGDSE